MFSMTKLQAQAIVSELSVKQTRTAEEQALLARAIQVLANFWR